ncbi:MAG TPA: DUF1573 domain-containing protein [Planctomycetaceae bacterium]|nr:DUF1573 domain-containing protein [Planctomycetaceae bacterium]
MRLGAVLAGIIAVLASTVGVVALLSPRPLPPAKLALSEAPAVPKISATGKHPKAVFEESEFDFGRMEVGQERSHEFTVRNEGEAPLILQKGKTNCQCTVSELETGQLDPGASAKITLTWKPTAQADQFAKTAEIITNDPHLERQIFQLSIKGLVIPRLKTNPEKDWVVPELAEDGPTEFTGTVISPVSDDFRILSLESGTALMSAAALPIDKDILEQNSGLSGYEVRVTLTSQIPVGAFAFPLTIKTDLPARNADGSLGNAMELNVLVSGQRRGPIRVIGRDWIEDRMAVMLGGFDASAGKKAALTLFVRGAPDEGFRLKQPPVCTPGALKVTLEPEAKSNAPHERFRLTVEYPAGAPRVAHREDNPGQIRLLTNHSKAPEIELLVLFNAY